MESIADSDSTSNLSDFSLDNGHNCSDQPAGYDQYRVVVDVYLAGSLCLVGFIGNALSMAVVRRDRDPNQTTNWLLQSLAVVDSLYLVACVFIQPIKTINEYTTWSPRLLSSLFPYLEPHIWALASTAQTMTVWVVLLVTCDRYLAVCMATRTNLRSLRRAKIAVCVVVVLAILYNGPRYFERQVDLTSDPLTNLTAVRTKKTAFRESKIYFLVYKTILYFIFRSFGPLVTLTVLNVRLINTLRQLKQRRSFIVSSRSARHRENITTMLVVVVSVFVVCELPDPCLRIVVTLQEFVPGIGVDIWTMRYANAVTNLLLTVNSSVNFIIYCLVGRKFRQIFVRMLVCDRQCEATTSVCEPTLSDSLHTQVNGTKIMLNSVALQKYVKGKPVDL